MSEAEKRKRRQYKQKRTARIILQAVILLLVVVIAIGSLITYYRLNQTYYIPYTETGGVDYRVQLKENDFYENEWQGAGQVYVSSLINQISADFNYRLTMGAEDVSYTYVYRVDAKLEIADSKTGVAIYQPVYPLVAEQRFAQSGKNDLVINQTVNVDYALYNDQASRFVETYQLTNATSTLILQMKIDVEGNCETFEENSSNDYLLTLRVPLTEKTVEIKMISTVPEEESRVLACSNAVNTVIFLNTSTASLVLAIILAVVLIFYVFKTRNHDINYAIKVKRIVSAYRSFIQQINNGFDLRRYQVVLVNSFTEMLGIRDTIGAPVLMHENEDKTRTQFYIPTATDLLYVFEIKVEDYDEIYANTTDVEEPLANVGAVAAMSEVPMSTEIEEISERSAAAKASEAEAKNTAPVNRFDFGTKRNHSFETKIELAPEEVKEFYRSIKTFAEGYGVKVVRSHKHERIYKGRTLFALLTFKGKKLAIALAMDPKTADPKYHAKDMSEVRRFEKTPMLMRVTSQRKVKYATQLLTALFSEAGIKKKV